ncbi:MAG: ferritin family protein [Methanolobus sp.]|jgi:rubrerythrin|nr:ferritin family protein [Methanolobus sp.]
MKDILQEIAEELDQLKSMDQAIGMAIELEEEGMKYYSEKASMTKNEAARELYNFLANEEKKHAQYLEQFRESKQIPEVEFSFPKFKASFKEEFSDETLKEIGILLGALRFEHKSEYFYIELADRADNEEQRLFFEKIAAAERGHYQIIDELLAAETEFRMQT